MRVLLSSLDLPGHWRPLLPVAATFEAAHHEPIFAVPDSHAQADLRDVAKTATYSVTPSDESTVEAITRGLASDGDVAHAAEIHVLAKREPESRTPGLLELIRDTQPDLLVRDSADLAGHLAGELTGLPTLTIDTSLAGSLVPRCRHLLEPYNATRSRYGLPAIGDVNDLFDPFHVEFMSRAFFTQDGELPLSTRFFRHTSVSDPLPHEVEDFVARDRDAPLVLVNFGTLARQPRLLMNVTRALKEVGCRALIKTLSDDEPALRRLQGDTVLVATDICPPSVLDACDLFICHGGYNSVKEAVAAATPLLVTPLFGDQQFISQRAKNLGAALETSPGSSRHEWRDQIARALDLGALAANMTALQDSMTAARPLADLPHATSEVFDF